MRRRSVPGYLLAAVAGLVLLAACSGGTSREPLGLDEYFERVQTLHEEQEQRAEVLGQGLEERFAGVESLDEALESIAEILPEFLPGFRAIIQETRAGLDQLDPPAAVQAVHDDLLDAYTDFEALIDEAAQQAAEGEASEEVLQTFLGTSGSTQLGARFGAIADTLTAIAEAEGIDIDLSAGVLATDTPGPPDPAVVAQADRNITIEPLDPLTPPGAPTGIADVDRVVATVLAFSGDFARIDALIHYTETGCTLELGLGGPPKCWQVPGAEQVEGPRVEVFPISVCETEYTPLGADQTRMLSALVAPGVVSAPGVDVTGPVTLRVYGIYQVPAVAQRSDWPAGDYAVVFAAESAADIWGTTVRIANGGIVSMEFGCGAVAPAVMTARFADQLLDEPLGGLNLTGVATITVVEFLPPFATQETTPQWQVVIDLDQAIGGYASVLVDAGTEVVGADGQPVPWEVLEAGQQVEISGQPLPWSLWRAERVVILR